MDALRTPRGAALLATASGLFDGSSALDPLTAAERLRAGGHPPDLARAALTQARLRARAAGKLGEQAAVMFFTGAGLEQATRPAVAARRAARLVGHDVSSVADLCCGIGVDAIAMARAGMTVLAVDVDPEAVAAARANADVLGLADRITVVCTDAVAVDLSGFDAVFCDPARRTGYGRVFDPRGYSPPWAFLLALASRVPRTVLKLGPGIDHALLPPDAEAEWVSASGDVVEAALWCGPLASAARRATLLPAGATLTGAGRRPAPVGPVGRFLYEPDGAVIRAGLVAELAEVLDARIADPTIAYLYSDAPVETRFARRYEVTDVLPFSAKRLRRLLRERGIGRLTVKKRGMGVDPDRFRRDMRLAAGAAGSATIALTRVAGRPTALLLRPPGA